MENRIHLIDTAVRRNEAGAWERFTAGKYDVSIDDQRIAVNGKSLPLVYHHDFAVKLMKTRVKTCYDAPMFFQRFFDTEENRQGNLDCWTRKIVKFVAENGKPC